MRKDKEWKLWHKQIIAISIGGIIGFVVGIIVLDSMFDFWVWKILSIIGFGIFAVFIEIVFAYELKPNT